jgi:N-methylhydantoinase B
VWWINTVQRGTPHWSQDKCRVFSTLTEVFLRNSASPSKWLTTQKSKVVVSHLFPLATEIYQEGFIIPPIKLWQAGQPNQIVLDLFLRNVRTPNERKGDLAAQVASNHTAIRSMQELVNRWTLPLVEAHCAALIAYAERIARATIEAIPDGCYHFTDAMDNDGVGVEPVVIAATVTMQGSSLSVDFTGSALQTRGNINAVAAVTKSAVYYVVRFCPSLSKTATRTGSLIRSSVRPLSIRKTHYGIL